MDMPFIRDTITLIMTSLQCILRKIADEKYHFVFKLILV